MKYTQRSDAVREAEKLSVCCDRSPVRHVSASRPYSHDTTDTAVPDYRADSWTAVEPGPVLWKAPARTTEESGLQRSSMTYCTLLRRLRKYPHQTLSNRDHILMACCALNPAMSPVQSEFGFGMIETHRTPVRNGMARGAIRTSWTFLELPSMNILMTTRTLIRCSAKGDLAHCRSLLFLSVMAGKAGHRNMSSA